MVDSVPKDARRDSVDARGLSLPGGVVVIRWWAGFASLGAGLIHLTVVSEHVAEWWPYGAFFVVLAVAQIAWAVQLLADDLHHPRLVAAVNAAVIGLWLVTRTTGLPVGPEPWEAEALGTADLVCSGLEAVVVVLLMLTARRPNVQESTALTKVQLRMIAVGALATAAVTVAALAANPPAAGHAPHSHSADSVLR
ncbi:hypothetical protein [Kribbella sp. NPDC050470]|uniref:hypothetical protein n=1 Tax=unclassified Kribbella TaxID=2644121 RepID=UPI0037A27154